MPNRYSIIEPHPSVPRTGGFIAGGRGGAGNYRRYASSELTAGPTAQGPPSRLSAAFNKSSRHQPPPSALPSAMQSQQQQQQPQRPQRTTSSNTAASSSSTSSSSGRPSGYASSGIGGAGNMFIRSSAETEERVFQFDEEMVKRHEHGPATPVYHIGRGGGGNWVDETKVSRAGRLGSASSGSSTGSGSTGSVVSEDEGRGKGFGGKLGRLFKA